MLNWLDTRTGIVSATKDFLTEDVPGGASYWYAFGSATLFAMILQIATGIFLCFYYAPSSSTAWESTKFLIEKVPAGHLVLSLHYWGASAMIAFMAMHLLQVLLWGAYKKPRELQWIVGVLLFIVTLVLGLTGYLLPWDLNALLASRVAINVAANAPILGPAMLNFLQDGSGIGTLTINRFFGIHVWLMPALLVGLVGLHLMIFRHNGPAGPPIDEAPKLKPGRFWPDQMFMDTVLSFAMFVIIVALAVFAPVPLDDKADPNNATFVPYPAWYFLALYAALDVVGTLPPAIVQLATLFATIIGPTLLIVLLVILPFVDRNPSRRLSRRPWVLGVTAAVMAGAIALSFVGQSNVVNQQLAHNLIGPNAASAATTTTASTPQVDNSANGGGSSGGGAATAGAGASVYTNNCAGCHNATGAGQPGVFPPLAGNEVVLGDPVKVITIVKDGLNGPIKVKGQNYNGQMPPWKGTLSDKQISDVITYIRSSWGNKASAVTEKQVTAVK
ncbi:MAG: cytochrome b N-terminal domain-containing protein [Candidatus Eremiobacteraeota bacterium]|nr:cytochrome b N-terminal domain-containing protein [Candidatus Eremiobacteraeota bacterium]MBV9409356.1 cytochrome b N-terminal domain-containing protein [Candidatus Eremiobacteraeota bacterium]